MGARAAVALALVAVAGVWSSLALGQVPGVTLPTVTVPSLTVPVPLPDVTIPSVTVTDVVTIPSVTTTTGTVQSAGAAVGGVTGQSGGSAGGSSGSSSGRAGHGGKPRSEASRKHPRLHAYPKRFKNRRQAGEPYGTTLSFWIQGQTWVTFFIRRESPECDFVGSFSYRARSGVNRVRWLGRYHGDALAPGTYRITAIAVRGSTTRSLGSVTVVIAPPNRKARNVDPQRSQCTGSEWESPVGAGLGAGGTSDGEDGADGAASDGGEAQEGVAGTTASSTPPMSGVDAAGPIHNGRVLGALPPSRNPFDDVPSWLRPLLLVGLAAAILLLLLAAVPAPALRPTGAATFVAGRRNDLAFAGATILGAVAIAALLL